MLSGAARAPLRRASRGSSNGGLAGAAAPGSARAAITADVGGLRDHVAFHRLEQLVAACRRRKIERAVEREQLENVVVVSPLRRRAGAQVRVAILDVAPEDGARRQAALG